MYHVSGLSPLLLGRNAKKTFYQRFCLRNVAKMTGECSNCSKILEFVNLFLKFPRFSEILFDVLNSQKFPELCSQA